MPVPRSLLRSLPIALLAALVAHAQPSHRGGAPHLDPDWLARASAHIAEREYRPRDAGAGLQAPNRAHDLRTWFEPTGVRVAAAADPAELLRLRLDRFGRSDALAPVGAGKVTSQGNRVEIRRPELVEWYVNSATGLEQGFTLAEPPAGDGPILLELTIEKATASLRGDAIALATETGRRLRYDKLVATDARDRVLVARLEVPDPRRVRLVVEDAGATYPVVIDPLLTGTADTELLGDSSAGTFGEQVAAAGDVNGDGYDDIIVGAGTYDGSHVFAGAAFVFLGGPGGIADGGPATAATVLESDQDTASFGASVAGAGDVNGDGYDDVIVGAHRWEDAGAGFHAGGAFVFLGSAAGIADGDPSTAATRITTPQAGARLGESVAGAGDVNGDGYDDVIVGAPGYDVAGFNGNQGTALVFLGGAAGIADAEPATAHTRLEGNQLGGQVGERVASAGDVNGDGYDDVVVSAPSYGAGGGGANGEGVAFVHHGSATGIPHGGPTTADTWIESGVAYLDSWSAAGAGDVNGDGYGDVVIGSAEWAAPTLDEGAVFVYHGSATGIVDGSPAGAATVIESNLLKAALGASVASAGDVNGDGYDDIIVGAPRYSEGLFERGAAFVFVGSPAGILDTALNTATAEILGDQFEGLLGWSVASAGDVDGDGFDDVIVASPEYDVATVGNNREGIALLFRGDALPVTACSDGIDNDNDGWTDFPDDPQCATPQGTREASACGLGGAPVLLLLPLLAHRIRRGRRREIA